MTVRDVRHHWPEAEKAVELEGGVIVTRDSKPVAQIIAVGDGVPEPRQRLDKNAHVAALKKLSRGESSAPWVDDWIKQNREHVDS